MGVVGVFTTTGVFISIGVGLIDVTTVAVGEAACDRVVLNFGALTVGALIVGVVAAGTGTDGAVAALAVAVGALTGAALFTALVATCGVCGATAIKLPRLRFAGRFISALRWASSIAAARFFRRRAR